MKKINYSFERVNLDSTGATAPIKTTRNYSGLVGSVIFENVGTATIKATINGMPREILGAFPQSKYYLNIPTDCILDLYVELEAIATAGTTTAFEITFLKK